MIKQQYINILISDEETMIQMLKYDQDDYINKNNIGRVEKFLQFYMK